MEEPRLALNVEDFEKFYHDYINQWKCSYKTMMNAVYACPGQYNWQATVHTMIGHARTIINDDKTMFTIPYDTLVKIEALERMLTILETATNKGQVISPFTNKE